MEDAGAAAGAPVGDRGDGRASMEHADERRGRAAVLLVDEEHLAGRRPDGDDAGAGAAKAADVDRGGGEGIAGGGPGGAAGIAAVENAGGHDPVAGYDVHVAVLVTVVDPLAARIQVERLDGAGAAGAAGPVAVAGVLVAPEGGQAVCGVDGPDLPVVLGEV